MSKFCETIRENCRYIVLLMIAIILLIFLIVSIVKALLYIQYPNDSTYLEINISITVHQQLMN